MNSNDKEASTSDSAGKYHTVQPHRDLESNWAVDLAKNLEEYLLKICSGEIIGGEDNGPLSVNFAEAALLLQGSIQVYSRKVEYLYSLVLHALEFISQKSQQHDQKENPSVQEGQNDAVDAPDEADDSFWGLDDIPVDSKNSLDSANCSDAALTYSIKPPANLVVLEGDCLDVSGDSGELESYLLATNDLYRDFILLDTCDAIAVDEFLGDDDAVSKKKSGFGRGSSLSTKARKTFMSPSKCSGGTGRKLSFGKIQDPDHQDNDRNVESQTPARDIPGHMEHDFENDDHYSQPGSFDDSEEEEEEDPWKPLNPHERGNLKVKHFRKVKAYRRDWTNPNKPIPLAKEFPLARLHGPISAEFNDIWVAKHHVSEKDQDSHSPPYYEKLRQSLFLGNHEKSGPFDFHKDEDVNDYDDGAPDFDMPENAYMNEDNFNSEKHEDEKTQFGNNEAFEHEDTNSHVNLEDLCRSHLDSLLASIAETEKQTALAARVSTWKQRIEQNLEEQDARPPFDIHEYGQRTLDKLSQEAHAGKSLSFADVVKGQEKHDVARTFSALLQLVNNGNVELERKNELVCYTASNPFYVRVLSSSSKNRGEVDFKKSTKKRAKSPVGVGLKKGKENSSPTPTIGSYKFGIKCTPEAKRRRRSRLASPPNIT